MTGLVLAPGGLAQRSTAAEVVERTGMVFADTDLLPPQAWTRSPPLQTQDGGTSLTGLGRELREAAQLCAQLSVVIIAVTPCPGALPNTVLLKKVITK